MGELVNNGFGLVTGTANALYFPDVGAISWLRIKSYPTNGVANFIGVGPNCVFPLNPGDDTGWFSEDNLSNISYKGSGTYFAYWFQS